jgi:hypothetical protein
MLYMEGRQGGLAWSTREEALGPRWLPGERRMRELVHKIEQGWELYGSHWCTLIQRKAGPDCIFTHIAVKMVCNTAWRG